MRVAEFSNNDVSTPKAGKLFEPWDLLRGKDVFVDRFVLDTTLEASDSQHWAPNCATFSRAREIPVPGVKNAPVPLRSEEFPRGIPDELDRLSSKSRKRLEADTEMADLAAKSCVQADMQNKGFTLEHPGRSIALHLDSWRTLVQREGVRAINYHTCMFEGSRRKKFQVLITNRVEFERMGKICKGNKICDRTGEPHLKWRPVVHAGKVMQFTTGDEREYPEGFCSEYAECMRGRLEAGESFVEIFSGPNAPLSSAVAKVMGIPLPGAKKETNKGVKTELQHLSQLISEDIASTFLKTDAGSPAMKRQRVENSLQRAIVVEAGKQPGYGKRIQLIPDGMQDPLRHLEAALTLEHPFESEGVLKNDHQEALEKSPELPGEADRLRLETLSLWKSIATRSDIRARQDEHEKMACESAKRLGRRPRTALMEYLQDKYYLEDSAIPTLCLTGIPIVGEALRSPFFTEWKSRVR